MKVSALEQTSPDYKRPYWEELDAMYRGGEALLSSFSIDSAGRSAGVLTRLMPKHESEIPAIYSRRLGRAVYLNYAGEILDYFIAKLQEDPMRLTNGEQWYQDWLAGVTVGKTESMTRFLASQMRDLLVFGSCWSLIDLPKTSLANAVSLAEQDASGAREAYAQAVCPLSVIDWELDAAGAVLFAVIRSERSQRGAIGESRRTVRQWLVLDARGVTGATWRKYEYVVTDDTEKDPVATEVGSGVYLTMPLLCRTAKDGLWLMDKMRSASAEHLRKTSNIAWFEANSLNQDLYEFLDTASLGVAFGDEQETGSAKTDKFGPGWLHQRKAGDRVEYVAPKSDVFRYAIESADSLRDEIHRICYMSALSLSQTGQSFARSAESRSMDKEAESIIVAELGRIAKALGMSILRTVAIMRGEPTAADSFELCGGEEFSTGDDAQVIESATAIQALNIPSKRFREMVSMRVVRSYLAKDATDEDLAVIENEIKEGTQAHSMTPDAKMPPPKFADEADVDGDDDEDDEDDE